MKVISQDKEKIREKMNKIDKLDSVNKLTKIFKELFVKDDIVDRKAPL